MGSNQLKIPLGIETILPWLQPSLPCRSNQLKIPLGIETDKVAAGAGLDSRFQST